MAAPLIKTFTPKIDILFIKIAEIKPCLQFRNPQNRFQMVIRGQPRKAGFIKVYPKDLVELEKCKQEKFIIKFGGDFCNACKALDEFIEKADLKPKVDATMYMVQIDDPDQELLVDILKDYFSIRAIPCCIVTNKLFKEIGRVDGFSTSEFMKMFNEHF